MTNHFKEDGPSEQNVPNKPSTPKIEPTAIDQAADLVVKETWKALRDLPIFDRAFRTVHEGVLEGMLKRQIEEAARLIKVTLDV